MTNPATHRRRTAVTAALVAGTVAGAALLAPPVAAETAPPAASRHTAREHPAHRHGVNEHGERAGELLGRAELPASFRTPATGEAYRVRYRSTDEDGLPTIVSGMVYLPKGEAPKGGRPVIAWDHGTVGVGDGCAPSVTGPDARGRTLFDSWLARGYAVVATDYEGLGTDGEHAYLVGRSAAYNTADIVRAARQLDRSVGRTWAVYGFSQGGSAALFTGAFAPRYAPELDFRGAAVAAPGNRWERIIELAGVNDPDAAANPYYALIVSGMATAEEQLDPADYLKPRGMEIMNLARADGCFAEIMASGAGLKNSDFKYDIPRGDAPGMTALLERHAEPPLTGYRDPLLIVQGTADTTIPVVTTRETAAALDAAGAQVTYTEYPGLEHSPLPVAALDEVNAWLDERLAR